MQNNDSATLIQRQFRLHFNVIPRRPIPSWNTILLWVQNFQNTGFEVTSWVKEVFFKFIYGCGSIKAIRIREYNITLFVRLNIHFMIYYVRLLRLISSKYLMVFVSTSLFGLSASFIVEGILYLVLYA